MVRLNPSDNRIEVFLPRFGQSQDTTVNLACISDDELPMFQWNHVCISRKIQERKELPAFQIYINGKNNTKSMKTISSEKFLLEKDLFQMPFGIKVRNCTFFRSLCFEDSEAMEIYQISKVPLLSPVYIEKKKKLYEEMQSAYVHPKATCSSCSKEIRGKLYECHSGNCVAKICQDCFINAKNPKHSKHPPNSLWLEKRHQTQQRSTIVSMGNPDLIKKKLKDYNQRKETKIQKKKDKKHPKKPEAKKEKKINICFYCKLHED